MSVTPYQDVNAKRLAAWGSPEIGSNCIAIIVASPDLHMHLLTSSHFVGRIYLLQRLLSMQLKISNIRSIFNHRCLPSNFKMKDAGSCEVLRLEIWAP